LSVSSKCDLKYSRQIGHEANQQLIVCDPSVPADNISSLPRLSAFDIFVTSQLLKITELICAKYNINPTYIV